MKGRCYLKHDYLGVIEIEEESDGISAITFIDTDKKNNQMLEKPDTHGILKEEILSPTVVKCREELREYFSGNLKEFTVKLDLKGSDFQKKAWAALIKIPYGTTTSYLGQAVLLGNPKAVRAIGGANSRNPIPIIVPCHRVIGKNGKMTGYAGGIWIKEYLLELEKSAN